VTGDAAGRHCPRILYSAIVWQYCSVSYGSRYGCIVVIVISRHLDDTLSSSKSRPTHLRCPLCVFLVVTGHWQERGAAGFKVLSSGLYYICTDQSPNACFFFGANCKFDSGIVGLFGQYGLQSLESAECDNIRMVRGLLIAATVATTIALCALIVFSLYKPQTPYVRYSVVLFCLCGGRCACCRGLDAVSLIRRRTLMPLMRYCAFDPRENC